MNEPMKRAPNRGDSLAAFVTRGLVVLAALAAACASPATLAPESLVGKGAEALYQLEPSDFYALPFPDDLRVDADGTIDLSGYPRRPGLLTQYVDTFDRRTRGFGTQAAVYFRFSAPIDPTTLPASPEAAVADDSSAYIVDITPSSPTFGQRAPLRAHFVVQAYDFIGPDWLALLPLPGFPLRENTTYAAVLTDTLRAADGGAVRRSPDFDALLGGGPLRPNDARFAAALRVDRPLVAWLASQGDRARHVVSATVFTTTDATSIMTRLRAAVYAEAPVPELRGLVYDGEDQPGVDDIYEGNYLSPNFQEGEPPYLTSGGAIHLDAEGNPRMVRLESLRVAMTIPKGAPMPAAGWPVILYAHGTGGNYRTFIDNGSGAEAADIAEGSGGEQVDQQVTRMATISIDQVLHGPRDPSHSDPEITFFNLQNLVAARDNIKQGALDDFQLLRLVENIHVAKAPGTGAPIRFDAQHIYFKGHSQGGMTGPLFLAAEPQVRAAILSGAGGMLIDSLLYKTAPVNIPQVVSAAIDDPLDEYHPLLSLVQTYFESADPVNYAHLIFREPPAGSRPKSVFQSLGIVDHYTPIPNIEALALALGVQPVGPILQNIDGLDVARMSWASAPLEANVAGGAATGVLLEYPQAGTDDGHFVIFDVPNAIHQSYRFLASDYRTGLSRLDPP